MNKQNQQLIDIMGEFNIKIYPYQLEGDDEELRAQRLTSSINDAMTNGDVIAVNTHCDIIHGTSKLLRPFIEQRQLGGDWHLNAVGEYLYRHMPSMV